MGPVRARPDSAVRFASVLAARAGRDRLARAVCGASTTAGFGGRTGATARRGARGDSGDRVRRARVPGDLRAGSARVAGRFPRAIDCCSRGHGAIVSAETTRLAARWVFERHRARGPMTDALGEIMNTDDLVAVTAIAVAFALRPIPETPFVLPWFSWLGITLGIGVTFGLIAVVAHRQGASPPRELEHDPSGRRCSRRGLSVRLGLPPIQRAFHARASPSRKVSSHRAEVDAMLSSTEKIGSSSRFCCSQGRRSNLTLLARARSSCQSPSWCGVFAKVGIGLLLRSTVPALRTAHPLVGLGLVSSEACRCVSGSRFALRFPGSGRRHDTHDGGRVGRQLRAHRASDCCDGC